MLIFAANKVIFGGARAGWLMHHKTGEVEKILEFTNWKEILNEEASEGIRINDLANPVAAKVHLLLYTNKI